MAGRHSQTKLTVASIYSEYDKAYALIQADCAKLLLISYASYAWQSCTRWFHSGRVDTYIGAKLQNTFEDNSMAKGKNWEFSKY